MRSTKLQFGFDFPGSYMTVQNARKMDKTVSFLFSHSLFIAPFTLSNHRNPEDYNNIFMARVKSNKLLEDNDDLAWGRFIGSGIIFFLLIVSFVIATAFLYYYLFASTSSSSSSSVAAASVLSRQGRSSVNMMMKQDFTNPPPPPPSSIVNHDDSV